MTDGLTRPSQAVILAGGRGSRLRPITDRVPKAMVPIAGKPFIEHVIERLRDHGFDRVLLLTGYLADSIEEYFGDGRALGVDIEYSVTEPDDLTCRRVEVAAPLIDPLFLLLYCDHYWPVPWDLMWRSYEHGVSLGRTAQITVYANRDGYGSDSVVVEPDGRVAVFDRLRTTPGLTGIEIGFAILPKSVLEYMPRYPDQMLFEDVYSELAQRRELHCYWSEHRYYSVGGHERLPATEAHLIQSPAVVVDASVLDSGSALEQVSRIAADDTLLFVLGGGPEHYALAERAGLTLAGVYDRHEIWQMQRDFHLDLTRSSFVGPVRQAFEVASEVGCAVIPLDDAGLESEA